ncbi:ribbon-helix-helix domain-containing protein [Chlorogloea sp. CCALA 695]|uniref:ribbon-helix-helix domain-containing protein n=1 Tax=Chlorogloea sp. CCALA 695 TaxID=2107693 RepID=UPI0011B1E47E|nr:ribbon-helix-helix domain-containing protein [Chlorogloea sp. CCALA 695]
MPRYTSTLPPIKINSEYHHALQRLADKLQTSTSQLTRQAIAELLVKHDINLSSTEVLEQTT